VGFNNRQCQTGNIGANFLHHFGLIIDVRQCSLANSTTHLQVNGLCSDTSPSLGTKRSCQDENNSYPSLLSEFPEITQACASYRPIKHNVCHDIKTTDPLTSSHTRQLVPECLRIARQEFDYMLDLGIIRPSTSSWPSPLHMIPKKIPGNWRPCMDFCGLNKDTILTDTLSHISRISQLPYKEPQFSHT